MHRNLRHRSRRTKRVAVATMTLLLITTTGATATAETAPSNDDRVDKAVEVIKTFEERGMLSKPSKKWNAPDKLSDGVRFISKNVDPTACTGIESIQVDSTRASDATPPPACRDVTAKEQQGLFPGTAPDCVVPNGCPSPYDRIAITIEPKINVDEREDRGHRAIYVSNDTSRTAVVAKGATNEYGAGWMNFSTILEDRTAPTWTEYDIKVPKDYRLDVDRKGNLVIETDSGLVVRNLAAPMAQDNDKKSLATTFTKLDHNTIRQDVAVPRDAAYPILADPSFYWAGWPIVTGVDIVFTADETLHLYDEYLDAYGDFTILQEAGCGLVAIVNPVAAAVCFAYVALIADNITDALTYAAENGECLMLQETLLPAPLVYDAESVLDERCDLFAPHRATT